ncbi:MULTISPECIES: RluA family pseudouridine synthase [Bacillus]|uniref:Pseudouridine synthase n=1 Tax=Bacillus wiedmannii TaxID=1890302 RepID=A0A2C4Z9W7_9BACI|nr:MULTISPECIES: RluA family pseudouridine synthase [Bacillus]MDF9663453.1 RluA family pseudouridine synthase [Bacillus wiedmannii]MDI6505806.1 RluA family pseudouridine synthase [Bacillus wiedmannii]MDI6510495.1 RluA family pseudouridine synthase [Bacillus wiedmannii]PFZ27544.1 RNA pseudouridine synthase [Bacillus wiedmannii]PGC22650.1 RNA pseudouridine synthase [Bacillus wiedmannii]
METKKKGEWCEITVPAKWNGISIDSLLKIEWEIPKKLLHQLRMEKGITVNGEQRRWNELLKEGDKLQVHMFMEEEYDVEPEYGELDVVYEDDHVLIVNKPEKMDTHPAEKGGTGTLANLVAFHFQMQGLETKVRHIHRLDKDTTGGVVFAKHRIAGAIMDHLLMERKIKRTYAALVEGKVKGKQGTIDAAIGRDRHHATRRRVSPKGDQAITYYKVEKYFKKQNATFVTLQLETGRTHQIRVHMSYHGNPLVGDVLYGGQTKYMSRQALHAMKIHFLHPITKEEIEVDVPFPIKLNNTMKEFQRMNA